MPRTCCRRKRGDFWDARPGDIERGIAGVGKFEGYFAMFRKFVLPLAHPRKRVLSLLEPRGPAERERFYNEVWDNRRWRWIFHAFFSRAAMGALGRDPEFFRYVEGSVADRILTRTRHALAVLDPSENPYLHWILTGTHGEVLPEALKEENFRINPQGLGGRALRGVSTGRSKSCWQTIRSAVSTPSI